MGNKQYIVELNLTDEGKTKFAEATAANIGKQIAIVYDDEIISNPSVKDKIDGGQAYIDGMESYEEADNLASTIRIGGLKLELEELSSKVVGAQLGEEAISTSLMAGAIGLAIVFIFMCIVYLLPGLASSIALVIYTGIVIVLLNAFNITLTLPGIAGIVLSIGMAVDANVLIYERTKEELRAGKAVKQALSDGYSNAFSAIFDSNLTSIITGIILYNFGTGPIRGFATTLIIGILVSFFTAVFLTRIVYEHFLNKEKWMNLTFTTSLSRKFLHDTHYKFMSSYKKSFTIFGVLLVVGIASLFVRGLSKGIDFTGGRNFVVVFEKQVEPETVRTLLQNKFGDANIQVIALGTDHQTVRISTNYRIDEEGTEVDSEIEATLFETLKGGGLLASDLDLQTFHQPRRACRRFYYQFGKGRSFRSRRHNLWGYCFCGIGLDCYLPLHIVAFPQCGFLGRCSCGLDGRYLVDYRSVFDLLGMGAILFGNRPNLYRCDFDGYRLFY